MRIPSSTLPSGGLYKASSNIEIPTLKYRDIIEHDKLVGVTDIDKYLCEIKTCISLIDNWRSIPLFDLDSLIFTIKYISTTSKPDLIVEVNCPKDGNFNTSIRISDIKFRNISELLEIKSVNINNSDYVINHGVTIGEFYELLMLLKSRNLDVPRSELLLIAYLLHGENINQVYDNITCATKDDIVLIQSISDLLMGDAEVKVTCPTCKEVSVVKLRNLITDVFRTLHINSDISSKITYVRKKSSS